MRKRRRKRKFHEHCCKKGELPPEWSSDAVDFVAEYPVCNSRACTQLSEGLRDRVVGYESGAWNLVKCDERASAYSHRRPTQNAMRVAYRSYYTHSTRQDNSMRCHFRTIRESLGNGYRSYRFGTSFRPSFTIGRWIVALSLSKAKQFDAEAKNLGRANEESVCVT